MSTFIEIHLEHGEPAFELACFAHRNGQGAYHRWYVQPALEALDDMSLLEHVLQALDPADPAGDDLLTQAWFTAGNRSPRPGDRIVVDRPRRRATYTIAFSYSTHDN